MKWGSPSDHIGVSSAGTGVSDSFEGRTGIEIERSDESTDPTLVVGTMFSLAIERGLLTVVNLPRLEQCAGEKVPS